MLTILEKIIDDVHPDYEPITDEEYIGGDETVGHFQRTFTIKETPSKEVCVKWAVKYGTPDTVQTYFEAVEYILEETEYE